MSLSPAPTSLVSAIRIRGSLPGSGLYCYLRWLVVTLVLVGCRGSNDGAKFHYDTRTKYKLGIISSDVFRKILSPGFDADRYPEKNLIKVSVFLGREDFNFLGEASDFKDGFGSPCMIRRIGAQWEMIAFGYNKINEEGGGDDIVVTMSESGELQ